MFGDTESAIGFSGRLIEGDPLTHVGGFELQTGFVKVAKSSEIPNGGMKLVNLGTDEVLVANVQGKFCAVGDRCTHVGGPLHEGELEGKIVTCPLHGSQFDVTNGRVVGPPARMPLPVYEVTMQGDDIMVRKKT